MGSQVYYYVTGHTSDGFVNYLQSNVIDLDHVFVLKSQSHYLKTAVLNRFINTIEQAEDIEVLLSPLGFGDLDGVIIRDKSIAVVVDTIMNVELSVFEIDLDSFSAKTVSEGIDAIWHYYEVLTEAAHGQFKAGLEIHEDLEAIYVQEMNFSRADELADELIQKLLDGVQVKKRNAKQYERMFGTNTAEGAVNVVPELITPLSKRYYLKGRAGTGKSHFMKTIMKACQSYGLDMEVYYCSFDPGSVDMVLIRSLDCCIFDSTDPHEFFPMTDSDTIIDLYEETVTPGTDETYAESINDLTQNYKAHMKQGIEKLREGREWLDDQIMMSPKQESQVPEDVVHFLYSMLPVQRLQ